MSRSPFPSVRTAGGLLPADLFNRILEAKSGESTLPGREPQTYGLLPHENVREAAARAFDYLNSAWQAFTKEREKAAQEGRTPRTRDRWLVPLLRQFDYGHLTAASGITVDGVSFPVSHRWEHVPIHLLGWNVDLDHRTPRVTAQAPQSMVQELLNRSDDHLWAILSNGSKLRLLRDSRALAGSAFVEFDLELIFSEQLFADFVLLFRLFHASRFAVPAEKTPADCWLERWRADAVQLGERALARLRTGVAQAINTLGTGFLRHPANDALRAALEGHRLSKEDYNRAILRLVYRLLFWFVAEDRDVLLIPLPDGPERAHERKLVLAARERYTRYFSAQRLRERAIRGGTDHHDDLWEAVQLVLQGLGEENGRPELAIPGLGGLFERVTEDDEGTPLERSRPDALDAPLEGMRIENGHLLKAIRRLAVVDSEFQRRPVNFRELDSEELGSVYEWLLEFHVELDTAERTFTLKKADGNDRKRSGSYYTPSSLTEALLDTTLDPVLDEAAGSADTVDAKVDALLNVTVCDPACGSGHFLVAAARRIARRVAQIRSGEDEPSPDLVRHAMREVVSRCIYGVDINDLAAELAKVSLWIESVEPGRPLAFLDTNIRVGNALLGATPALIDAGIPKEAFKPIEGDDRAVASAVAKENAIERDHRSHGLTQVSLFDEAQLDRSNAAIAEGTRDIVTFLPDDLTKAAVQRRRLRLVDAERRAAKRVADAWCAAFVQELTPRTRTTAITQAALGWIGGEELDEHQALIADRVDELTKQYQFFHWHVEFPHVFRVSQDGREDRSTGWNGGFSCVIGNPPWERVKIQEKEFFASRNEDIANAKNAAARKKAIAALKDSDEEFERDLYAAFTKELRQADGITLLLRDSCRYPLTGRGDINTYAVFAETGRMVISPYGRVGMVLPTGIATDATTQFFLKDMVETKTLASLYDFENEEKLFPNVDHRVRFCLWSGSGRRASQRRISLAFRLRQVPQIAERRFVLTPEDITRLNPNTGTLPVFDYKRNADITIGIYRRVPVLWPQSPEHNPWGLSFLAMLHMANDSDLFRPSAARDESMQDMLDDGWTFDGNVLVRDGERLLPLYEAKMLHHFDDRFGTYEGQTEAQANVGTVPRPTPDQKDDPTYATIPRYWVPEEDVEERLCPKEDLRARRVVQWDRGWLLGWRDICRSSDTRTVISFVLPRTAIGHTSPLMLPQVERVTGLYANLCSFVLDFVARQKMAGTHLTYSYLNQLPVLPPSTYEVECPWDSGERLDGWVRARALELTYTSYAMEPFARDHGDDGPPYRWDEERRFKLRAELDAAYFHLYGVTRDDVEYIMDSFRAFRNVSPDLFARTKNVILEIYETMAKAIADRTPYRSVLTPPPGQGPRHPQQRPGPSENDRG
ncbi:Eco57I restriction-modification methylase domain-containing protein [Microbispora sp. H10949]|uniref:Eco57I restriction-modification methylase domain-containing protein n=1 Tax=Microbispora sp. H10949 TaxID=2729111 RepID=UPI001602F4C1|nr:DNA methyltransferase [Microbispora sp. H10949]